jgi:fumarate reductase subunit D
MSELRLFLLQRLSAAVLAVLVVGHLTGIILFTHWGLSAAEILRRVHSSLVWPALYGLFALAAVTHGAIGLRAIGRELWRGAGRPLRPHRHHLAWWAFAAHRLSGLAMVLFLPLHFAALGQLVDQSRFDAFLDWTRSPVLKASEALLVAALALHLAGGLRLLALEFLPWSEWQKSLIALSGGFAAAVSLLYLLWGAV